MVRGAALALRTTPLPDLRFWRWWVWKRLCSLRFKPLRRRACRLGHLRSAHETLTGLFQQLLLLNGGGRWFYLCFKDWVLLLRLRVGGRFVLAPIKSFKPHGGCCRRRQGLFAIPE